MGLPKNAKKVFEGVIYDVYHWRQKMFDGSFETFEMIGRKNTVEVLATRKNKILVAEQEQPNKPLFYSPFGGRQDKESENPLETIQREFLEEAGMASENWELWQIFNNKNIIWYHYIYFARDCKKVADQKLDPGEKINIKEVSFEEFLDLVELPNWRGEKIRSYIFRIKQDSVKLETFRKKLFGLNSNLAS